METETVSRVRVPLPDVFVARPIALEERAAFEALSEGFYAGRVPHMALSSCVALRTSQTRRGMLARQSSGKIALAVAATLRLPDPRAYGLVRSAVIPLDDVALDAYEDLLTRVRPVAHDVALAERLRRSGSLARCWWIERDEESGGIPQVYSAFVPRKGPPS